MYRIFINMQENRDFLKKMFEDESVSKEEKNVIAGILGKSLEECLNDWSKQFRLEYATNPVHHPTSIDLTDLESEGKILVTCKPYFISSTKQRLMALAGNIDADYHMPSSDLYPRHTMLMTVIVSFNRQELNRNDIEDLVIGMFGQQNNVNEQIEYLCAAMRI